MRLPAIDTDALLELVWVSIVAAFAVALTFSLFVHGSARATEARAPVAAAPPRPTGC